MAEWSVGIFLAHWTFWLGLGRVIYDSASAIYSGIIMILSICIKSGTWLVMDFLFLKYYDMMHACLRFCNLSGT